MNTPTTLLAFVLLLILAACGGNETPAEQTVPQATPQAEAPPSDAATAELQDGVQVIELEAGANGYEPETIALRAGVPARLIVTRTTESACLEQIQIPDLGISAIDLPLGEPVEIEFTPEEAGSFQFICGMNMQHGTLLVKREA